MSGGDDSGREDNKANVSVVMGSVCGGGWKRNT